MNHRLGILLALSGTFLFSLKPVLIKYAYALGANSEQVITLRMLIALPFYMGLLLFSWVKHPPRRSHAIKLLPKISALGVLGYFIASYLDLLGLQYISAQLERVVLFCFPTIVVIMSKLIFKTQLPKNIWWLLLISYSGILLIFGHDLSVLGNNVTLGTLLVFVGAIAFAFYVLYSKPLMKEVGSQMFTSIAMIAASLAILAYYASVSEISSLNVSYEALWVIVAIAVFSTVIPSLLVAEAIQQIGPERTSIIGTCGPVVTSMIAVWFLGEAFTVFHGAGLFMVILAVSLMMKNKTSN